MGVMGGCGGDWGGVVARFSQLVACGMQIAFRWVGVVWVCEGGWVCGWGGASDISGVCGWRL